MELFNKPLDQVTLDDIQAIVQDKVPESRTLDYKLKLHPMTDGGNKEFLRDTSAFANTMGGYLIYGVDEQEGVPTEIKGVEVTNFDKLKLHFENLLRTGADPVIRGADIHAVDLENSKKVVIINIPRSIARPHAVRIKKHFRFYGRNSSGVHQLEVDDLRRAFLASETLAAKIRSFRDNRIAQIASGHEPYMLADGAKVVLHLIPASAFELGLKYNISQIQAIDVPPIYSSGWDHRYNFDGYMTYRSDRDAGILRSYTQFFYNGIIEAVDTVLLCPREENKTGIPSVVFEGALVEALSTYLKTLSKLDISSPIWVCLALLNVKGYWMWVNNSWLDDGGVIDRTELIIPEVRIDKFDLPCEYILKPLFDSVWNACGYQRSFNYDENGNWKLKGK